MPPVQEDSSTTVAHAFSAWVSEEAKAFQSFRRIE